MSPNPLSPLSPVPAPAAPAGASARFTPLDPLRVLRQHARLLLLTAAAGLILGAGLWWLLLRYAPEYRTGALLQVTGGVVNAWEDSSDPGRMADVRMEVLLAMMANEVELLRSDEVLSETLSRPAVRATGWFGSFANAAEARQSLRRGLSAAPVRGSTQIMVDLRGRQPGDIPRVLDELLDVYISRTRAAAQDQTMGVRKAFNDEREEAAKEFSRLQEQLAQFTAANDLSTLQASGSEAAITYETLASEVARASLELQQTRGLAEALLAAGQQGLPAPTPDEMAMVEADPAVQSRIERMRALREQREVYLDRFGENHRQIRELDMQLAATEQEKKREVERLLRERQAVRLEQARKAVESGQANLAGMQARLEMAREAMRDLTQKLEQYKQMEALAQAAAARRDRAEEQLNAVRLRERRPDNVTVKIQLRATEAERIFPTLPSITVGFAALLTAVVTGLVFLRELLDQRIKSPSDVSLLPAADLLGVIPEAGEDPRGKVEIEQAMRTAPNGLIAETYRRLRSAVLARAEAGGAKVLLLAGPYPRSGVSTVAANLAVALGANGRRTLLIDANFRRPGQQRIFATPASPGLVDVLAGRAGLEAAVTGLKELNLDVLPVGEAADARPEMLESPAFQALLTEARGRYDLVLIDAPPALLTSDAALAARHADAVVVVARAMHDKRGTVSRLLRQMGDSGKVLGVVLNAVRAAKGGYFRKNYEAFYQYARPATR